MNAASDECTNKAMQELLLCCMSHQQSDARTVAVLYESRSGGLLWQRLMAVL
jgi:hypothetical protein